MEKNKEKLGKCALTRRLIGGTAIGLNIFGSLATSIVGNSGEDGRHQRQLAQNDRHFASQQDLARQALAQNQQQFVIDQHRRSLEFQARIDLDRELMDRSRPSEHHQPQN